MMPSFEAAGRGTPGRTIATLLAAGAAAACWAATEPPPGFEVTEYATGLEEPVALAFAPDGRLFVTERKGRIRIIADSQVQAAPFAELEVHTVNENGLLGIALDPNFPTNHYVYVLAGVSAREQQILRFTDVDGVGADPVLIRGNLPGAESEHAGGGLAFGPDGKLYVSIGDTGDKELAQDLKSLAGKICRINRDGSTPTDNPFVTPTGSPRAVYALGFRNPFRLTFAPDGRLFVADVGSDDEVRREEVNLIRAGDNAGWPLVEGAQAGAPLAGLVEPLVAYHEQGQAVTGLVYYSGTQFPEAYRGNVFHLEFVLNRVYRLVLDNDAVVGHELFYEADDGGPVDIVQAPDGSLVFSEIFTGRLMQIRYNAADGQGPGGGPDSGGPAGDGPPSAMPLCGFGTPLAACGAGLLSLLRFGRGARVGRPRRG